jgi:5-methylcytosine-specific restriction endonuclease McrA
MAFGNDRQKTDGRRRSCRECDAAIRRANWQADLSKTHERARLSREKNAEKIKERKRRYQQTEAGRQSMLAASKRYAKTDKGRSVKRTHQQRYSQTERGKTNGRMRVSRRRALLLAATGTFTTQDWQRTLKAQHNRCFYCNKVFTVKRPPTIDHVIPLSKGGTHSPENIVAACRPCNSAKWNRLTMLI